MKYTTFDDHQFRQSVDQALQQVAAILGTAKNPRLAEEEDHTYQDKYALAEYVTNSSVAAVLQVLDRFGLDSVKLQTLLKWVEDDKKTVTLSFRMEDKCALERESEVEQVTASSPQVQVTETTATTNNSDQAENADGNDDDDKTTTTTTTTQQARVVHKVKQYHWQVHVNYALAVYPGSDTVSAIELQARNMTRSIVTSGGMVQTTPSQPPRAPIAEHTIHNPLEVDITWLLSVLNRQAGICQFAIDRSLPTCKTPRRNEPVEKAVDFQQSLMRFAIRLKQLFVRRLEREIMSKHNPLSPPPVSPLSPGSGPETDGELLLSNGTSARTIFHPILPLMENGSVLPPDETGALLNAHSQSMDQAFQSLTQMFPPANKKQKLATTAEAGIMLLCHNIQALAAQYINSINYVEGMLTKQLIQAIGKTVNAQDFDQFMQFHNQKLFGPAYAPKPFTYAIRRPNHFPDGIISIEAGREGFGLAPGDMAMTPIDTMVRRVSGKENPPILMPINAATSIEIGGDRFLHGWIRHSFASETSRSFQIAARARQFSSFLLVLGKMAGKNKFAPKQAIILRNKDEVLIPLLTEVLPTAKEFKDAISSLSPEQQAFAKAYRGMQLESSVFGICVIQLKPQLEKLLNLSDGSLTKEIQLTEDLMSLFVDYQVPSDLMSFEGDASADKATKLAEVKSHVKAVMDAVTGAKEKQLMEEERKKEMREAQERAEQERRREYKAQGPFGASTQGPFGASTPSTFGAPAPAPFGAPGPAFFRLGAKAAPPPSVALQECKSAEPALRGAAVKRTSTSNQVVSASNSAMSGPASTTLESSVAGKAEESGENTTGDGENLHDDDDDDDADDFTLVPKILDGKVEKLDSDNALKPTILKAGDVWTRTRQENLLTKPVRGVIKSKHQREEKDKAFDLLDALSRSGTLSIDCAELHVIVALSHCFENDVMGTVIQDNINPIEKAERSALIVGSTIHDEPCPILLQSSASQQRLGASFPALFVDED